MGDRRRVEVGTVRGRCGSCRAVAELTLSEIRPLRRWRDLFRRGLDRRVDRQVRCSACGRRYAVGAVTLASLAVADE